MLILPILMVKYINICWFSDPCSNVILNQHEIIFQISPYWSFLTTLNIFEPEQAPFWILPGREADFSLEMPKWYFFSMIPVTASAQILNHVQSQKKGTSPHPTFNYIFCKYIYIYIYFLTIVFSLSIFLRFSFLLSFCI